MPHLHRAPVVSRLLPLTVAVVLGCIAVSGLMAADEVDSETWEAVDAGSTPFNSIHTQRQQPTPKSRRIIQESRALVDLLGRKQEIRERLECDSTLSYEPVSLLHTSKGPSGTAVTEGVVQDGALVLTLKRGKVTLERRIAMDGLTILSASLPEVLAAQDPSVKELRLRVIDPESWTAEKLIAQRLADADGLRHWKLSYERGWGDGVWSLTPAGVFEKAETTAPRRNIRRAAADCDEKLRHFTIPDRELLVFPVSQDLPFPERLRSLKVRLTWRGIAPEQLQLEDSRQRVLKVDSRDGQHYVEVLLEQPKEIASAPPLPVRDAALAKCLEETPLIQAQHPLIRDQARQWIDGAKTTHEAARQLAQEVSQYLRGGDLIAETLSGAEVLACRTGKCSEFTTLMASLARSSGLPTRVALGMRMTGGRWVGHMWCEVWVGQWIPVDAAANEVGGSPALLKLCHSDTVRGSQSARWAVAESLSIEIIAVEKDESGRSTVKTGIVGQTYSNADFACQISAPKAGWKVVDKSVPRMVQIRFEPPAAEKGAKGAALEFFAFGMPFKAEPDALTQAVKTRLAIKFPSLEVLSDTETKVLTRPGRKLVFRRDDPNVKGSKFKTTEVMWVYDRSVFMLKLSGEESLHDAGQESFQALLGGFQEIAGDTTNLPDKAASPQKPEKSERPRPESSERSEPASAQPQDATPSGAQIGPRNPCILVGHSDWVTAIAFSPSESGM